MKYIFLVLVFGLVSCGCVKEYPKALVVPQLAPKIERVVGQSTITKNSAEATLELAKVASEKHKTDTDVLNVEKSARQTVLHSQETERQLKSLEEYAKEADKTVNKLSEESDKKSSEINKLKQTIEELKRKLASKNTWLVASFSIIFLLGCLIIKPWKFFI